VPLTHHDLDSTHISEGVVRAGVETGPMTFEASVFRGEEPDQDDNRYNIEKPMLDSWAARVSWHQGPWQAQFSGGRLRNPEWFEPYENTKITASIEYNGAIASRPLAVTLAWGHHAEDNGFNDHADGYLLEWDLRGTDRLSIYGRTEHSTKEIFVWACIPRGSTTSISIRTSIHSPSVPCATSARRGGAGSALAPTSRSIACRKISTRSSRARDRFTCSCDGVPYELLRLMFTKRSVMLEPIEMPPLGTHVSRRTVRTARRFRARRLRRRPRTGA